jgi:hypothetical protein
MKASLPFTNNKRYLIAASQYLQATKEWFLRTPERALNQAYNAVMQIKSIEDEYLSESAKSSDYLISFVETDFARELAIAKLRLAEFKASCLVLGVPVSAHLDKLTFMDGVLAKYISKQKTGQPLLPPSSVENIDHSGLKNQLTRKNIGVGDMKTTSEQETSLAKAIAETIGKTKKELASKTEAEVAKNLQSSNMSIKTIITGTAIKYTLLLVLLPLLYQQISKQFFQPNNTTTIQQEQEQRSPKE